VDGRRPGCAQAETGARGGVMAAHRAEWKAPRKRPGTPISGQNRTPTGPFSIEKRTGCAPPAHRTRTTDPSPTRRPRRRPGSAPEAHRIDTGGRPNVRHRHDQGTTVPNRQLPRTRSDCFRAGAVSRRPARPVARPRSPRAEGNNDDLLGRNPGEPGASATGGNSRWVALRHASFTHPPPLAAKADRPCVMFTCLLT
jgi:hypothetical protein